MGISSLLMELAVSSFPDSSIFLLDLSKDVQNAVLIFTYSSDSDKQMSQSDGVFL